MFVSVSINTKEDKILFLSPHITACITRARVAVVNYLLHAAFSCGRGVRGEHRKDGISSIPFLSLQQPAEVRMHWLCSVWELELLT